jgi:hypothetical protein
VEAEATIHELWVNGESTGRCALLTVKEANDYNWLLREYGKADGIDRIWVGAETEIPQTGKEA